jgi:DNA-directed RNA polymerase subunit F
MTTKLQNGRTAAIKILEQFEPIKGNTLDKRRADFVKIFKAMSSADRRLTCLSVVDIANARFASGYTPDDVLWVFLSALAAEQDSESMAAFLEFLIDKTRNSDAIREVAISLLELADNEFVNTATKRLPVGPTALVMLTEMGLMLAARVGRSKLDPNIADVVEYITSSLLARSNVTNTSMRLSLVHFLSRCPINTNSPQQLARIINRFGHTLLEDLTQACFEDKKRSNAAFHFLVQHLNVFFVASPALAEMSIDVLRHAMLRFPEEFPSFLSSYCQLVNREPLNLSITTRCVTILLQSAIEVGRKSLAQSLSMILLEHLEQFKTISADMHREQVNDCLQIARASAHQNSSIADVLENFAENAIQSLQPASKSNKTVVSFASKQKAAKIGHKWKSVKFGQEPSPLESILALAS